MTSCCCADLQQKPLGCRRGDKVTVRSLEEILATLDGEGKLDGVPFMPEMARCCGRTFTVFRRADKTCVEGYETLRALTDTVFLEGLRCDGSAHDGCQRGCLMFWKEAWLVPAGQRNATTDDRLPFEPSAPDGLPVIRGDRFYCQSTELGAATSELPPGDLRYFFRDFWIGEASLGRIVRVVCRAGMNFLWRRLFGREFFRRPAGEQQATPPGELDLQPGEWVEVKSAAEIKATLNPQGRNRGLSFEPEMLAYCGRRYRVLAPVRRIIAETTGKMLELRNTVVLEGLTCEGICAKNCPRSHYFYWREIWLKRIPPA